MTSLGKPTFSLEPLASANGYTGHDAHDALGDVRAAAYLLRLIAARAPLAEDLVRSLADKASVVHLLEDNDFVLVVGQPLHAPSSRSAAIPTIRASGSGSI